MKAAPADIVERAQLKLLFLRCSLRRIDVIRFSR